MPSKIRMPPPPPLPLPIPLLFLLLLFSIPSNSDPSYSCPQLLSSCGNLTDIPYPFWFTNDSIVEPSSFCGYLDLKLICQNNVPILRLANDIYVVTHINPDNYTISLADADIFFSTDPTYSCPRVRHNLTVSNSTLSYAPSDANITFFFNCTGGPTTGMEISCLPHAGENRSYVFTNDTIPRKHDLYRICQDIVVTPILKINLGILSNGYDPVDGFALGEALHEGFQLSWPETTGRCGDCEHSGGRCGFNRTSKSSYVSTCFCKDGVTAIDKCEDAAAPDAKKSDANKNGKSGRTVIVVTASIGVFLLLCASLLFYKQKKKRANSPSSKSLIQNISSKSISKDPEKSSAHFQTHLFSSDELEEATNCFDASKELGDGGFGTVYKGELRDGRTVAVKRLYENNYRRFEQFKNEIEILSRLRHQNLVDLYGCTSRHSRELLLVYEFVPNGTVADHLHGSRASEGILTWPMRLNIAIETADALAYLHAVDPPIIHRDVKTSNILLDGSFHVKVGDFGLSRLLPSDVTHVSTAPQGTPGYLDPDYYQCYQLTDKSDVYSFGVVLIELISSKPAVDITRHRKDINLANMAINRIQNGELDQLVDEGLGYQSDQAIRKMITMVAEVAFRCLQLDGDMRPPLKEVLEALRAIQSEGHKVAKDGKEAAENGDDAGLLKNIAPMSPDSVMNKWVSSSTTPNTSK